jgi:hypothetical protein
MLLKFLEALYSKPERRVFGKEGRSGMEKGIPSDLIREIFPRRPRKSTLSEVVYGRLKRMILKGEVKKGQRLVEEQIAHRMDVSRTPVRAAFQQLENDRLIVRKKEEGVFVA